MNNHSCSSFSGMRGAICHYRQLKLYSFTLWSTGRFNLSGRVKSWIEEPSDAGLKGTFQREPSLKNAVKKKIQLADALMHGSTDATCTSKIKTFNKTLLCGNKLVIAMVSTLKIQVARAVSQQVVKSWNVEMLLKCRDPTLTLISSHLDHSKALLSA